MINMPEEDRAMDIGNAHKNLVKIACVVPEISSQTDRHTDRQTNTDIHTHHNTYNNNNNNPICKAPECQKSSVALVTD